MRKRHISAFTSCASFFSFRAFSKINATSSSADLYNPLSTSESTRFQSLLYASPGESAIAGSASAEWKCGNKIKKAATRKTETAIKRDVKKVFSEFFMGRSFIRFKKF